MTSYINPIPFVLLKLESVEKEVKNHKKIEYLENEELFRWYKKHFSQFLKGYQLVKK